MDEPDVSKLIPGKTYEPGMVALDELDNARARIASLEARLRAAEEWRAALRRIADPTEMTGDGVLEEMVGPAKRELDARMALARKALATASGEGEAGEPRKCSKCGKRAGPFGATHDEFCACDQREGSTFGAEPPGVEMSAEDVTKLRAAMPHSKPWPLSHEDADKVPASEHATGCAGCLLDALLDRKRAG